MHWRPEVALACLIEEGEASGTGLLPLGAIGNLGWIVLCVGMGWGRWRLGYYRVLGSIPAPPPLGARSILPPPVLPVVTTKYVLKHYRVSLGWDGGMWAYPC